MRPTWTSLLSLFISVLLFAPACLAQTTFGNEGIPAHTVEIPVPLGFVSATTGQLHLEIPMASIPQRNFPPLIAKFVYDTDRLVYGAYGNAGWIGTGSGMRLMIGTQNSGTATYTSVQSACTDSGYPSGSVTTYQNFRFIDFNGTVHQINNQNIYTKQVNCQTTNGVPDPNQGIPTASGTPEDRSGYTITVSNYNLMQVTALDGTIVYDNTGANPYTPKDTNGNYLNGLSYSQPDTLGRSPISADGAGYGCPGGQNPPPTATGHINVRASDGSTAVYTVNCTALNVSENYTYWNGTSNVTVAEVGTESFLTSLVLPDGSQYAFTYDTGNTPTHQGDLIGITLPTGGQVSFTYVPGDPNPGASVNFPGRVSSATFGGGTWSLSYTSNSPYQTVTTLLSPPRYDSVSNTNISDTIVFTTVPYAAYLQTAQYYSGSSTLFKTISFAYSGDGYYLPTSVTTTLNDTGQSSQVSYQYFNGWRDHVSQKQETDFSGNIIRTTNISYSAAAHNKPSAVNIYAGSGTGSPISTTLYTYDEYSANYCKNGVSALTNWLGATSHDDANYGMSWAARGNVTTLSRLISGTTYAISHSCYDTLGNVTQQVDANGNPTSYDYGENWADTSCIPAGANTHGYPSTITDAMGFRRKTKYYTCTGLPQSVADENDIRAGRAGTTYTYDGFSRPLNITYPDTGQTSNSYPNPTTVTTTKAMGSQNLQTTTVLDGLGRVTQSQLNTDPDCASSDKTDTTYDALGRKASVSNPYCSTSDPTYGITSYAYDALGRVTQVAHPGGTFATSSYTGAAIKTTDEGNGTQSVQRVSQNDALGRLISVCEVSTTTLLGSGGTPAACGQSIAATGFLTTYQYDVLDNLLQVNQGTLNARTFAYDSLSRLLCASNPETSSATCPNPDNGAYTPGTIRYAYDPVGNLISKSSPAPNQTGSTTVTLSYCYDPLNRLTTKAYTQQSCPMASPVATFTYDATTVDGLTLLNPAGRLVKAAASNSATVNSYDPMGRIKNQWQCTPQNCGTNYFALTYSYDLIGDMTSATNGAGVTFTFGYSPAARLRNATSSLSDANHPANLFSNATYNAPGEETSGSLGNGVSELLNYDTRGRLKSLSAGTSTSNGTPATGSATVSGSEQSIPPTSATSGTGTVSISGSEQSTLYCPYTCTTIYDGGSMQVTVNGFSASAGWGQGSTAGSVASALASSLNSSSSPVTAVASGTTVTMTAKVTGSATNYSVSASVTNWNSQWFTNPSFTPSTSGPLTGGADAKPAVYDSGSVWVTVNGFQASASYGQGSTSSALASAIVNVFNTNSSSPVTASVSGATVSLTTKQVGAGTNFPLSSGSSTSNPTQFSHPSFSVSTSGSSLTGGSGGFYTLTLAYAPNSNVTSANDTTNGNWTYSYDALNRLVGGNKNGGAEVYSYDYDRYGNRWHQNGPHAMMVSFSGNNNRMDSYSYDAAGNLLNDGAHSYAYDAENRITQVDGGATATYAYDAEGQRVRKTSGGASVDYLYDLSGHEITEFSSTGSWNRGEVYAGTRHLATYGSSTTYFNHSDWLGTERVRSNMAGGVYETCTSLPFGDWLSCSAADSSPMHFTGQQRDSESGLDNFIARYIGSNFGRFLSADPENLSGLTNQDDPQAWNAYAYARNNPIIYRDPHGTNYLVCQKDEPWNCADLTKDQYEQFLKDNSDITKNASGELFVGNTKIGTATYYNERDLAAARFLTNQVGPLIDTAGKVILATTATVYGIAAVGTYGTSTLLRLGTAGGAAGPVLYKTGDIIEEIVQTPEGPVKIVGDVVVEGTQLTIKDISIFSAETGEKISVGVGNMLRAVQPLFDRARDAGYSSVRIVGERVSGATPGRIVDITKTLR